MNSPNGHKLLKQTKMQKQNREKNEFTVNNNMKSKRKKIPTRMARI